MIDVVGTMFFKSGKILIDKPRKRSTYQMVGGRVEESESILDAAIRECREELGENVSLNDKEFSFVMDFIETATSDPTLKIHMHIFIYNGEINDDFVFSKEIEDIKYFGVNDDFNLLSNSLRNKVIPYCIEQKLMY